MERIDTWDALLKLVGETLEDAGKALKDGGIEMSSTDLQNIVDGLNALVNTLDQRIVILKEQDR